MVWWCAMQDINHDGKYYISFSVNFELNASLCLGMLLGWMVSSAKWLKIVGCFSKIQKYRMRRPNGRTCVDFRHDINDNIVFFREFWADPTRTYTQRNRMFTDRRIENVQKLFHLPGLWYDWDYNLHMFEWTKGARRDIEREREAKNVDDDDFVNFICILSVSRMHLSSWVDCVAMLSFYSMIRITIHETRTFKFYA